VLLLVLVEVGFVSVLLLEVVLDVGLVAVDDVGFVVVVVVVVVVLRDVVLGVELCVDELVPPLRQSRTARALTVDTACPRFCTSVVFTVVGSFDS
jgi:hypothetical protein